MHDATRPPDPAITDVTDKPRREIIVGLAIAAAFFVFFLGWAALARLDAGAYAPGQVVVSGSRQAVQHREGGIVSVLAVREGDRVQAGQVLLEIAGGDLRATERGLTGQVYALLAQRARMVAERDGRAVITRPPEFAALQGDDLALANEAMRLQQLQFSARGAGRSTQNAVLGQRIAQLTQQIQGYERQLAANREQSRLIAEELEGMRSLAAQGYAPQTRVRALERTAAGLEGEQGALQSEIARAQEAISETRLQMVGVDTELDEGVAEQLRQTEIQLNELQPRLSAIRDQIARASVRAPTSGQVIGLTVFTVGGVVQPGQTLMEIVPEDARLLIEARVSPNDADDLRVGQIAQVRFTAFHEVNLPIVHGEVTQISADSFTDDQAQTTFFKAMVSVPVEELERLSAAASGPLALRPGLPVEVVIPVRKRTALDYLLEPLTQMLWRSGREQ